jgi:hypothetical protein
MGVNRLALCEPHHIGASGNPAAAVCGSFFFAAEATFNSIAFATSHESAVA